MSKYQFGDYFKNSTLKVMRAQTMKKDRQGRREGGGEKGKNGKGV